MLVNEPVPVVKQEPVNVEATPLERVTSINAEFGSSTIDPLDVKEELLDHHHKDIINDKKSAEHYPEKFMNRPGPAPKRNEPIKLYNEVYIKTEPSNDEHIVYDVPSDSDEMEIPDFDGDFSDDDELENSDNNVEIGNVTSIKEEPLDHQLAN